MKWTKPHGIEIETNDREDTIEYCKSLGWKEVSNKPIKQTSKPKAVKK